MSAANKQNGTSTSGSGGHPAARHTAHSTGRRVPARRKTARWTGKAVPAVAMAATLAAGAAAYGIASGHSDSGRLAVSAPVRLSNAAHAPASPSARPARAAASAPAAQPTQTASMTAVTTFTCSAGSAMLPQNVTPIVNFLVNHGYSHNAAAGIAGNMYQESKGNPEAVGMGGGGLIGFTPLPAGYVTGNAAADLQKQLQAVLAYNQIWAAYLPRLNAAATPAEAASIYVTDFERAGIPAASTREASAQAVASACGL